MAFYWTACMVVTRDRYEGANRPQIGGITPQISQTGDRQFTLSYEEMKLATVLLYAFIRVY